MFSKSKSTNGHVHKWGHPLYTYAPPAVKITYLDEVTSPDENEMRILMGVTTVMRRCVDLSCSAVITEMLLGKIIYSEHSGYLQIDSEGNATEAAQDRDTKNGIQP